MESQKIKQIEKSLKPIKDNKHLKEKLNILYSINDKTKYLDYKLINNILKDNHIYLSDGNDNKVSNSKHKQSSDSNLTNITCDSKSFNTKQYKHYLDEMKNLIKSLDKKLKLNIQCLKDEKSNDAFFNLLNTMTLIQLLLMTNEGNDFLNLFFLDDIIDTIYCLTLKEIKTSLGKAFNNVWYTFKKLILTYTVNNFFIEEIKYRLVRVNPSLYLSLLSKFSKNSEIVNNYYPKKIYLELILNIFTLNLDINRLKTHFALTSKDEYTICKYKL